MSFQDAVRTCLMQKYADFSGRARRSEYWFFVLFGILAEVVWSVIYMIVGRVSALAVLWGLVGLVVFVGLIVPSLAVAIRRLHDTGRSGWWLLLSFVPFGGIVLLVFFVLDSSSENQYGSSPKLLGAGFPPPVAPQY